MNNSREYLENILAFSNSLYAYALRLSKDEDDAKDIVQETIIKALRNEDKFKQNSNLQSFLHFMLKNVYIDFYRKMKRKSEKIHDNKEWDYSDFENNGMTIEYSSNRSISKFIIDDCNSAINRLNIVNKDVFIMFLEGFKYEEIASELNIPVGTVKTRIFNSRKQLQKELLDYAA